MTVAAGILVEVVLVVLLGFVETAEGLEFDGGFPADLGLKGAKHSFDHFPILDVIVIDAGAVPCAFVLALFVQAERVDHIQE